MELSYPLALGLLAVPGNKSHQLIIFRFCIIYIQGRKKPRSNWLGQVNFVPG